LRGRWKHRCSVVERDILRKDRSPNGGGGGVEREELYRPGGAIFNGPRRFFKFELSRFAKTSSKILRFFALKVL